MKLNKKTKIFIFLILSILILALVMFLIIKPKKELKQNEIIKLDFKNRIEQLKNFDSGKYYKIGWLQVQGTNIDLPIIDATSNIDDLDYSFGWRSPLYVTGENREVLIGHNILNVSSTPMLSNENLEDFEALMSFSYYSFAKDNLYIKYTKDYKEEIYLIYAIGFYDYNYDKAESINDPNETTTYIETARKNSIYDYDIDVNNQDQLLTVKTCTRYFGANEKQQFIIDARKVRDNEEIVKYSVKTNQNFENLIGVKKVD